MPDPDVSQQIDERLSDLYERHLKLAQGNVEGYYEPGRGYYQANAAGGDRDRFAVALAAIDGDVHSVGDDDARFALQSISKVFVYALALEDCGRDHVLERVGVEPSGDAFYSIEFDERNNKPYNPMVNAGAIVTTDLVRGKDPDEKLGRILETLRAYAGNPDIDVDWDVYEREQQTADRNRAITYLMRSGGMIGGDAEEILALYLQQCSVTVTCRDLAVMASTLANGCVNPLTGERVLSCERVRDVLSVMYTCGMYDFAGQWAFEVGVPAKSGVSGGILAVIPGKMGIGVFSPGLDVHGNSVRGVQVCGEISGRLGLHVFATEGEDAMLAEGQPVGEFPPPGVGDQPPHERMRLPRYQPGEES